MIYLSAGCYMKLPRRKLNEEGEEVYLLSEFVAAGQNYWKIERLNEDDWIIKE